MKDFISEIISRINVNSFEDYQRLVGRFEGFKEVIGIIDEILREDEENDL